MGIGGSYHTKGINNDSNDNTGSRNSSRGRSYGMMLVMGFGAALLGVLILHKLRERRIYNLIVQHKDQHLFSLQLLFQKERDYSHEIRRNNEEMKAKIYTLRNQKLELDRRLIEMQSTIDSLKDELKKIEAAFEEKRNEVKTLRVQLDQIASEKETNPKVVALIKSSKEKVAEIPELKCQQLENSKRAWSMSSDDDPSRLNTAVYITVKERKGVNGKQTKKFQNMQGQSVNGNAKGETSSNLSWEKSVENSTEAISQNVTKFSTRVNGVLEMHEKRQTEGEVDRKEIRDNSDNGVLSMGSGTTGLVSGGKGKKMDIDI